MKYFSIIRLVAIASIGAGFAATAQAQQFNQPYSFQQQNRAQLAVAMKQMEDGGGAGGGIAGVAGTQIVCGGGAATATANNTCIILNNSTGEVTTDQLSDGDQTASNSEQSTVNGETTSGADEILSTLQQR